MLQAMGITKDVRVTLNRIDKDNNELRSTLLASKSTMHELQINRSIKPNRVLDNES